MRHPKILIAGIGLAAVAAAGGITAASAASSPASSSAGGRSATASVHATQAVVSGRTETILVNGQGLPLYFYRPDTATRSLVNGELATLWPPLTSAAPTAPTATGVSGKIAVIRDAHGDQVAYNGHLLYTFADDHADHVTGQGVENFFVATPGLTEPTGSAAPGGTIPAAPADNGYGY